MKRYEIEKYASFLCQAKPPIVRDSRLLMDSSGPVSIYYAPFEYINPSARVVLVGITPGPTQMVAIIYLRKQNGPVTGRWA